MVQAQNLGRPKFFLETLVGLDVGPMPCKTMSGIAADPNRLRMEHFPKG
jgi:hypothetical protein